MNPRDTQDGCIISDDEIEMAMGRMMREQFGTAEPPSQSWQKLRTAIVASKPINPQEEIAPRLHSVKLAWLNMFVPRILQSTLAIVLMLATLLTGGAEFSGFSSHTSSHTQIAPIQLQDSTLEDPPVRHMLLTNRATEASTASDSGHGNTVDEAERVHPQIYYSSSDNAKFELKTGEYIIR